MVLCVISISACIPSHYSDLWLRCNVSCREVAKSFAFKSPSKKFPTALFTAVIGLHQGMQLIAVFKRLDSCLSPMGEQERKEKSTLRRHEVSSRT